jgi:hypothetical protein
MNMTSWPENPGYHDYSWIFCLDYGRLILLPLASRPIAVMLANG